MKPTLLLMISLLAPACSLRVSMIRRRQFVAVAACAACVASAPARADDAPAQSAQSAPTDKANPVRMESGQQGIIIATPEEQAALAKQAKALELPTAPPGSDLANLFAGTSTKSNTVSDPRAHSN